MNVVVLRVDKYLLEWRCCKIDIHTYSGLLAYPNIYMQGLVWKQASTIFCNYKENKKNNTRMLYTLFIDFL